MLSFAKHIVTGGDLVGGWVGDILKNQKLSPPVKVTPSPKSDFIGGWVGEVIKGKTPVTPKPPVSIPTPKNIPTPNIPTPDIGNPAMTGKGTIMEFFQNPTGLTIDERYKQALEEAAKNPQEKTELVGGIVGDTLDKLDERIIKSFEHQMELQREATRQFVIDIFKATGGFILDVASVGAMAAFVYYCYMVMMGSLDSKEKHTQRLFISGMSIFVFRILKALLTRC